LLQISGFLLTLNIPRPTRSTWRLSTGPPDFTQAHPTISGTLRESQLSGVVYSLYTQFASLPRINGHSYTLPASEYLPLIDLIST
jgi:hypothetical protein